MFVYVSLPGGGGYADIVIHKQALAIFLGFNFEFQYFWVFSEKIIFWGA